VSSAVSVQGRAPRRRQSNTRRRTEELEIKRTKARINGAALEEEGRCSKCNWVNTFRNRVCQICGEKGAPQ
jgi:hypothetical protein